MRKMIRFSMIITLFSLLALTLASQTLEEQLLNPKELKLRTYYYQASAGSRDMKLLVLENITKEFDDEKYSTDDKTLLDLLTNLSQEGSLRVVYENGRKVNDFPEVRREAIKVLAKVGGDEARNVLIDSLLTDKNDTVRAEICIALEQDTILDNANGDALSAIIHVYRKTYRPTENFVFAIINAVKKLAKPNMPNFPDAISLLSDIQMGNYSRKIRTEALKSLNDISGIK